MAVIALIMSAIGAVCGIAGLIISMQTARSIRNQGQVKKLMYYDQARGIHTDNPDDLKLPSL